MRSPHLQVYLSQTLLDQLDTYAGERGLSRSEIVRAALVELLESKSVAGLSKEQHGRNQISTVRG